MNSTNDYATYPLVKRGSASDRIVSLLRVSGSPLTAAEIARITNTWLVYRRLVPLEARGIIISDWDAPNASRRRVYWLNATLPNTQGNSSLKAST